MEELFELVAFLPFQTGKELGKYLNNVSQKITPFLNDPLSKFLKNDFEEFLKSGQYVILRTFIGYLLFSKKVQLVDKVEITYFTEKEEFLASSSFLNNTKGEQKRVLRKSWLFPNYEKYPENIKILLLIIVGRVSKKVCEEGGAYMEIENSFKIDLKLDTQLIYSVDINISNEPSIK